MSAKTEPNPQSYYRSGELLRQKHRLAHTDTGRRFEDWALGLVPLRTSERVLDAGCGWGRFTWAMVDRFGVPAERVVATDLSLGMLSTARQEAQARGAPVRLCQAGIEALPFSAKVFDLVVAGHVLYHLRDIAVGVRELARVLRPDGCLLATTNSSERAARVLVLDLHYRALADLGIPFEHEEEPFSMENGRPLLETAFGRVDAYAFRDTATAPDVAAFMAGYRTIGRYRLVVENPAVPASKRERLAARVQELAEQVLAREGVLRSEVLMGAFVCTQPQWEQEMSDAPPHHPWSGGRTAWAGFNS